MGEEAVMRKTVVMYPGQAGGFVSGRRRGRGAPVERVRFVALPVVIRRQSEQARGGGSRRDGAA